MLLQPHKLLLICQSPSQSSPSPWRDFFLLPEAEHPQPLVCCSLFLCVKCGFRGPCVCLPHPPDRVPLHTHQHRVEPSGEDSW